ncbi:MAG TPA: NAD(P)-binding domain-containing protein, partial [Fimbriimonadaceae bacterium]|nr:NAD(P)-binding domain-containing protein [Fimbriimonadaceae bacterium]
MVQVVRDKDVIWEAIVGRTVAMIGFGSQGAAQAQNLRDSGAMVRVGVREGKSADAARSLGFAVSGVSEAVQGAEFIVMALPDVEMGRIYREAIGGVLSGGACLVFSHGFAVHYGLLEPLVNIDVVLAAPM